MSQLNRIGALNSTIIYNPGSWVRVGSMMSTGVFQATALIPFYGTRILAYGVQFPKSAKGLSCSVDGLPASLTDEYDMHLCNVTVPLGQHYLTITKLANDTVLSIDYFLVSQPVANSPYIQPTSSSNSSLISTTAVLSPKKTYNQPFRSFPSDTTSSSMTLSSSLPTISSAVAVDSTTAPRRSRGTLIGGTVGGLALFLVVIVIVGVWFVKRRRRANKLKAPSAMFVNSSKSLDQLPYTGKSHHVQQM